MISTKRILGAVLATLLALVFSACGGGSPTGPSPRSISIAPQSVFLAPGMSQCFTASGSPDNTYTWSVTGGGTLTPEPKYRACLVAGDTGGEYRVTARYGDQAGETAFTVVTDYSLEYVSSDPPSGGEPLFRGIPVRFTIRYRSMVPNVSINVAFLKPDGKLAIGGSAGSKLETVGGDAVVTVRMDDPSVVETTAIRINLRTTGPDSELLYEAVHENLQYRWK